MTKLPGPRVAEPSVSGSAGSSAGEPERGRPGFTSCSEPGCHAAVFTQGTPAEAVCAQHRLSRCLRALEDAVFGYLRPGAHDVGPGAMSRAIVRAKEAGASPQEIQRVTALGRARASREAAARVEAALVSDAAAGRYPEGWLQA